MKKCSKCKIDRSLNDFYKLKSSKDGKIISHYIIISNSGYDCEIDDNSYINFRSK